MRPLDVPVEEEKGTGREEKKGTSIVSTDGSGNVLSNYSYVYDGASQVISETDNGVTTNYAYNAAGELTQAGDTSYSYDANGNPTGPGYVIGTNNQLLSDGTYDYTYDANGNMATQTTIATGVTWTYGYNNENQMTSAVQTSSGGTVLQSVSYTYDAFGNRVSESVTVGGVTTTTQFVYDQAGNLYETLNGAGAVQTKYVAGVTGADSWLAQVNGSGGGAWLLQDHVDSVRLVVNLTGGTVLDSVSYDALGNITTETSSSQGSMLKFQGGMYDAVTGETKYGARSEENGRWTTPDPMFPTAGSNAYEFVGNDPVNATDSSGLYEDDIHFYMTYYIAYRMGLNNLLPIGTPDEAFYNEAYLVAWADAFVDHNPGTQPITLNQGVLRSFHFRIPSVQGRVREGMDAEKIFKVANDDQNLYLLGIGLHAYQDTFSHAGFGTPAGHIEEPYGGHQPDYPWSDPKKALRMARGTYEMIKSYMAAKKRLPRVDFGVLEPELKKMFAVQGIPKSRLPKASGPDAALQYKEAYLSETKGRIAEWQLLIEKLQVPKTVVPPHFVPKLDTPGVEAEFTKATKLVPAP